MSKIWIWTIQTSVAVSLIPPTRQPGGHFFSSAGEPMDLAHVATPIYPIIQVVDDGLVLKPMVTTGKKNDLRNQHILFYRLVSPQDEVRYLSENLLRDSLGMANPSLSQLSLGIAQQTTAHLELFPFAMKPGAWYMMITGPLHKVPGDVGSLVSETSASTMPFMMRGIVAATIKQHLGPRSYE